MVFLCDCNAQIARTTYGRLNGYYWLCDKKRDKNLRVVLSRELYLYHPKISVHRRYMLNYTGLLDTHSLLRERLKSIVLHS